MMRPLVFDFPADPACSHLDRQYMLGDSLLVAPVFSADGDTSYYVPAGRWTDFGSGATVDGPTWVHENHGFDSVPLLVRPGSVLAVGARDDRPDYDYADGVTLRVYQLADGQRVSTSVPAMSGAQAAEFVVVREGDVIRIDRAGSPAPWQVLLVGRSHVAGVDGATALAHEQGTLISVPSGTTTCSVVGY
jgi:alpha-D-xyloside xylohydrolase